MAAVFVLLGGLRALGAEWAAAGGGETDPPLRHWEAPPFWRQLEAAPGREALAGRTALAGG
ncbi:MAG TPA: hypothetical protein PLB01_20495, partial [Thermoanaerobaculia bacterium]|nr:hypothetical protein [Thermoanaerobaculia bacterium]